MTGAAIQNLPAASTEDASDARKAAQQLEAYFIRRMLAEVRTSSNDPLMGGGTGGKMFQEMLDDALSDSMAGAGGFGIADIVAAQLEANDGRGSSVAGVQSLSNAGPRRSTSVARALRAGYGKASALTSSPLAGRARMTSGFGPRIGPISGKPNNHRGIDMPSKRGAPVRAAAAGTVLRAGPAGVYGNTLVLDHGGGLQTRYSHLESIDVAPGDTVPAGADVAKVGSSGIAKGPHLHFEVWRDGQPVDPTTEIPELSALRKSLKKPR